MVTVKAGHSGNPVNFHKRLIFLELSTETEDTEQNTPGGIDFLYLNDVASGILRLKNTLNSTLLSLYIDQQKLNSPPLFLAIRSIRI
jgi:hypothetical protein